MARDTDTDRRAAMIEEAKWWQREAYASAQAASLYRSAQMRHTAIAVQETAAKYSRNAQAMVYKLLKGG